MTNPQSLNRYAYVLNNPATLTDPLGLDPYSGGPGDPCSDPTYADSHARCGWDPCTIVTPEEWSQSNCSGTPGVVFPGGGDNGDYTSVPPAGQPPLAGGTGFEPGAVEGTIWRTLPSGGAMEVLVEACGLNPALCAAVATGVNVVGVGYFGYQLYKHLKPSPAASVPQATAQAKSQPNTDWEICYLRSDQLRESGFHTCYYICEPSKRRIKRVQKDACDPFTDSILGGTP